jgi:nitroimidazol reductase NimA-like FMN-containing flavoprotein (pyridoxamine 5'-phosphate oxidase superfamily)
MADTPLAPGELQELERSECFRLLATGTVGRVAFTVGALPAVQPVVYHLDGEEIVFRTQNGSKLAAATRHAVVGFEVDDIDLQTHTGWSVLGVGEAYEVVDPARLAALADTPIDPWVRGHDAHTIAVPLQLVTGRRLTTDLEHVDAHAAGSATR